jgi:hypothetical protein
VLSGQIFGVLTLADMELSEIFVMVLSFPEVDQSSLDREVLSNVISVRKASSGRDGT